jgi:hypothetical protein
MPPKLFDREMSTILSTLVPVDSFMPQSCVCGTAWFWLFFRPTFMLSWPSTCFASHYHCAPPSTQRCRRGMTWLSGLMAPFWTYWIPNPHGSKVMERRGRNDHRASNRTLVQISFNTINLSPASCRRRRRYCWSGFFFFISWLLAAGVSCGDESMDRIARTFSLSLSSRLTPSHES